ncbi:DUF3224 domain-containing protein [Kitasatospora sp. NBC_01302]|uniref:DUF3224 domain-containing protein n=1 Tax=Kitasatospora sp. NBC_01302 TaxID=2903575 RepID=UPI002E0D1B54|nr:DUF3224 domain-containing protein [Kitasatospora sp. NBC_01302]
MTDTSSNTTTTTGRFTSTDWQEHPIGAGGTAPRLARARVANDYTGGIEATGTVCEYTLCYATGKTGAFNGLELLTGRLDGRTGGFVIEQRGTFHEDGSVRCAFEVVPDSGTGELTGLRGSGSYVTVPGEPAVSYSFGYHGLG